MKNFSRNVHINITKQGSPISVKLARRLSVIAREEKRLVALRISPACYLVCVCVCVCNWAGGSIALGGVGMVQI